MNPTQTFDVIVIGGSYSGLSAGLALGRSLRKVLIIDGGEPCNRQTPHSQNFLTQDGEKPAYIAQKAKTQVLNYSSVSFQTDHVTEAIQNGHGFRVSTQSGQIFYSKKLILATGLKDNLPEINGLKECWGISVIHCPYCHGYEYRSKKTEILANGEKAFNLASLVSNLTDQLRIITSGPAEFETEQRKKFQKHGIQILEKEILEIKHEAGHLKQLIFTDGTAEPFDAIYTIVPFEQPGNLAVELSCKLTESGHIHVDDNQQTSAFGVYACGDCTSKMRSIAFSVSMGNIVGALVNQSLAEEEF